MRFAMTLAAALIVLSGPPHPRAAHATRLPRPGHTASLFTLAGAGTDDDALAEGRPAAVAPLEDPSALAALPDGTFLAGTEGVVWGVDPQARLQRVAGQPDREGYPGDGGPALAAEARPDHLAALPGGGSFALRA